MKLLHGFQTLFLSILSRLTIPLEGLKLTDSAEHHKLYASGWFRKLLLPSQYPGLCQQIGLSPSFQPQIILIGNLAAPFETILKAEGCSIVAVIDEVGMYNIEAVTNQAGQYSFDLALVSAGTAAKFFCTSIAQQLGKVALDTGQLFEVLIYEYGNLDHERYQIPYMSFM